MIHFAHPVREQSMCGATGDVRWSGIRAKKADVCPSCWVIRKRLAGVQQALRKGSRRKQEDRENRAVRARENAREEKRLEREALKRERAKPRQLDLFGGGSNAQRRN